MTFQTEVKTTSTPALVSTPVQNGLLQRKCPNCNTHNINGERDDNQQKHLKLQRRARNEAAALPAIPPVVHDLLLNPGEPLDNETRAFMEPRFGHDFGEVRVHADETGQERDYIKPPESIPWGNISHAAPTQERLIQFKEMPDNTPARDAGEGTEQGVNEDGIFCARLWIPWIESLKGKVRWEGIDQNTLNENVRLKPEVGSVLKKATANATDTLDGIYFGSNFGRRVYKVPDYCTATISGNLNNISCCCNLAGMGLDELRGNISGCRWVTPDEFGIPNNWENL